MGSVPTEQVGKLDALVLVRNESKTPCFAHQYGTTIFLVARKNREPPLPLFVGRRKNRFEPLRQLLGVRRPHADVPMKLVVAPLPADVGTAKHHSPKASGRKCILQPPVAFGY